MSMKYSSHDDALRDNSLRIPNREFIGFIRELDRGIRERSKLVLKGALTAS